LINLVAGGAGFIGTHLCRRLLDEGETVIAVDNLLTGRRTNVELLHDAAAYEFVEHDIVEPLPRLPRVDRIYHLASPASPPAYFRYQVETLRVNSEGTLRLLELAERDGARFLFASTSEIYGDPLVHPQPETYWGNVNSTGPRSMYDEAKRYGEALTMAVSRTRGVDTRIVRIFNTYGPLMDPGDGRVVVNFICQALRGDPITIYGDGTQTRSFAFVDDLVDGLVRLTRSDYSGPVNIGNPDEFTMLELAEIVLEMTGGTSELVFEVLPPDDPKQRQPDIALARRVLGWEPRVPLREGLARTIAYFAQEVADRPASSVAG
jgi:dTDP-glucose 4,6-dehydratase